MAISVTVCGDVSELGRATLARLHGPVVAISGGSTFEALFPHWTGPSLAGISFVPVDERKVELDAPGSNWKVAIQGLLRPNCLADQADHWTPSAVHLESLVRRLV